jgi:cytochrome c oxidase cbb3-type subunit 2
MTEQLRHRWLVACISILLIAGVYFYFLIFAQFAFLHILDAHLSLSGVRQAMGVMALGGIAGSCLAVLAFRSERVLRLLQIGFFGCVVAGFVSGYLSNGLLFICSGCIGGSVGLLTVSLIGYLSLTVSWERVGIMCGLGTGIAYFLSNVPFLFNASATVQGIVAGTMALLAFTLTLWKPVRQPVNAPATPVISRERSVSLILSIVLIFLVLIWMDSAAFRLIQTRPELIASSWSGNAALISIGIVHFAAAVLSGWLVDRGYFVTVVLIAALCLALGYFGTHLHFPFHAAGLLYAAGVSFYSVPLVAILLRRTSPLEAVHGAGWLFAIAGWVGSALGIGMADDLGHIPTAFWILSIGLLATLSLIGPARERSSAIEN